MKGHVTSHKLEISLGRRECNMKIGVGLFVFFVCLYFLLCD